MLERPEQFEREEVRERAVLVGIRFFPQQRSDVEEYLDELALLADTAGADTVARVIQERKQPDPAFLIGRGKAKEIGELARKLQANLVIFDDDLSPAQVRNLENTTGLKILDRSGLILDIFARHAKTREARTQVELAQLQYLMPRLTRRWSHLSRQEGGIGTRGPGETQLEVDRRLVQKRIALLARELEKIRKQRETRRKGRKYEFKVALIGYTNTGKSTLLNALTHSNILAENRLFATLDSTIRSYRLDPRSKILLIDTVGFIRKLPHHLIASFRSTLEEVVTAELLLHVVDVSHPALLDQIETVQQTLKELNISNKPQILVFNKVDLVNDRSLFRKLRSRYPDSVFISAEKGIFLSSLVAEVRKVYDRWLQQSTSVFPMKITVGKE